MKVFVLGKNGMLGRYVYNYLSDKFDVVGTTRDDINAMCVSRETIANLGMIKDDVLINCVGLIRQRKGILPLEFVSVNSVFPLVAANYCDAEGIKMIHITTDCVFSGKYGNYNEESEHDTKDIYGVTKSLGEPSNVAVIRTSIIGEELENKLSLLEWVKSQRDKTVGGYVNHFWNGITCLQFAKICEQIIVNNLFWTGIKHVFSPERVSKHDLILMISEVFGLNINVLPSYNDNFCDRTLSSMRYDVAFEVPYIKQQLKELKDFSL